MSLILHRHAHAMTVEENQSALVAEWDATGAYDDNAAAGNPVTLNGADVRSVKNKVPGLGNLSTWDGTPSRPTLIAAAVNGFPAIRVSVVDKGLYHTHADGVGGLVLDNLYFKTKQLPDWDIDHGTIAAVVRFHVYNAPILMDLNGLGNGYVGHWPGPDRVSGNGAANSINIALDTWYFSWPREIT